MNKKSWIIFGVIVAAIIGGMIWMSTKNKVDMSDFDAKKAAEITKAEERNGNIAEHVQGKSDSKIVLIEYGDYQCPPCGAAYPIVKDLTGKYGDKIAFVFRNYPVATSHPNARVAAATAEAAGLQGKFWEMHDLIFEKQKEWSGAGLKDRDQLFVGYGKELGLDEQKLRTDIVSDRVSKKIDFDMALGKIKGVTGTPAFYLNGDKVEANELETKIKEQIEKTDQKQD